MVKRLVDPRMVSQLQHFFPQRCTFKRPVKSQSTTGKEITTPEVVPGYEALPCRVAPANGGERRVTQSTYLEATHSIALPGQFPDLTEEWTAVVDGRAYQIL